MSKLLMNQLAATNMVYSRFSFGYFLDSMDRLGIHRLELYGCSTHFHFYDGDENPAPAMKKLLRQRGFQVVSLCHQYRRAGSQYPQQNRGAVQALHRGCRRAGMPSDAAVPGAPVLG